jgi:hypothetical protein
MPAAKRVKSTKSTTKRTPSKKRAAAKTRPSGKATKKKTPPKSKTKPKSKFRQKRLVKTGKKRKIEREGKYGSGRIKTAQVCETIIECKGNMSMVARNLGISRTALYLDYVDKIDEIRELMKDVREGWTDDIEDKLISAAGNGEAWAICFYLKCQGKSRGYIEKFLLGGQFGQDIKINITGSGKTAKNGSVAAGIN